ncbi:hypothetical protein C806_04066 [Lachnospiraceae bacterium 3-1]|nr:hypothetical protein C806_04066 [Lachnospiraceae bacterium 3-1]
MLKKCQSDILTVKTKASIVRMAMRLPHDRLSMMGVLKKSKSQGKEEKGELICQ